MGDNDEVKIEEEFNTRSSRSMLHCQDDITKKHGHLSPTGDGLLHCHQPLPYLPNELIIEILLRLPVKSLLLFKFVCKLWKNLISDPKFAKNHLQSLADNRSITHQPFIFDYVGNVRTKIFSFPMKALFEKSLIAKAVEFSTEHKFSIYGSCNGLLCLCNTDEGYVKLWNPSIRLESKESPNLDCYDQHDHITYNGFGYDHVNHKYKVLVVVSRLNTNTYIIEKVTTRIYTFGTNSWTYIKNFPCNPIAYEGKFVSGTLNWIFNRGTQGVILSFDLEKETYNEVLLPNYDSVKPCNPVLGVLSNCLCVCFCSIKTDWDIWLMKTYGVVESWTRLTTIPF